jgi:hypothetical protein
MVFLRLSYILRESAEYHSRQEWAACADCASLIDAGEWHSLNERALTALVKRYRLSRSEIPFFRQQNVYVFPPLSQGGKVDGENRQPIKEIFARASLFEQLRQIRIGSRHHAHLHPKRIGASQPLHFSLL